MVDLGSLFGGHARDLAAALDLARLVLRLLLRENLVALAHQDQRVRQGLHLFRGGLVFEARRLVYYSTLGWKVIKKKKRKPPPVLSGQTQEGRYTAA